MSPKTDPTRLAWIDLETTGLDLQRDTIIEIALVVTDMQLHMLEAPYTSIVRGDLWEFLIKRDPFVLKMHTMNGLYSSLIEGEGKSYRQVTKDLVKILKEHGEIGDYLIAGSGVASFDLPWIKTHLPDVGMFLQYSAMDIGPMRRFIKYTVGRPEFVTEADDNHRALSDVAAFLDQAVNFKNLFDHFLPEIPKE